MDVDWIDLELALAAVADPGGDCLDQFEGAIPMAVELDLHMDGMLAGDFLGRW